ncbi:MAG: DUF2520 domain-containing protein, partial [Bacillota bacterium]|nr:DUF2520 domain-containing protein [Bacillota bacterium]
PDDAIRSVAERMSEEKTDFREKVFGHFSGSLSSEVLSPLQEKGASTFSLHPAQSFSDPAVAIQNLPKTVFTAEGTTGYETVLSELFHGFPNCVLRIEASVKVKYHAAMVMLSNYLATLYALSEEMLQGIGMSSEDSSALLVPLLDSTAHNLREKGFQALTGPLKRGDGRTVEKHLLALQDQPTVFRLYRLLAEETVRLLAIERGEDESLENMRSLIKQWKERGDGYEESHHQNIP